MAQRQFDQSLPTGLPNVDDLPIVRIEASTGWGKLGLGELWEYRELLYFLTWRDILVRYKQTILGAAWAILQPFMTMVVFTLFFGKLANLSTDGIPGPIFYFSGLVIWTFFSTRLNLAANSMVNSANMIKKIYFPRLALPIATVVGGVVDFAIAFAVLLAMMLYYGIMPTLSVVWLPFFVILAIAATLGVSLWLAAMNVQFRDIRYTVPFITQFWLFATPLAYPTSLIEDPFYRVLYALNPMVGVVDGFRWALLGLDDAPTVSILLATAISFILLFSGAYYFRRIEKTFADVV